MFENIILYNNLNNLQTERPKEERVNGAVRGKVSLFKFIPELTS